MPVGNSVRAATTSQGIVASSSLYHVVAVIANQGVDLIATDEILDVDEITRDSVVGRQRCRFYKSHRLL